MKIVCPQCGFTRDVQEEKLPRGQAVAKCPKCACRFRFSIRDGAGAIVPPKTRRRTDGPKQEEEEDIRVIASNAYKQEAKRFMREQMAARMAMARQKAGASQVANPWLEAPAPDGWLAAFYQTVIRVMFQCQAFFGNLLPDATKLRPLVFFLIICVFQTLVDSAWAHALYAFLAENGSQDPQLAKLLELLAPSDSLLFTLLLRVGSFVLQLYLFSLLMYLAYRAVSRETASFSLVFQALCYSTAPWILCVVPGIGSIIGTFWGIGCAVAGCRAAMRLTWAQTLVGFLPIVFVLAPLGLQIMSMLGG